MNEISSLHAIECGNFKLDGGAVFGVVPKMIWERDFPADQNNRIELSTRSLLIETSNRLVLIDTGMGNKQSEKFFGYYSLYGSHSLEVSLRKAGFSLDDITDVFFTHLHFDHCGGAIKWNADKTGYIPTFKNAQYWSNESHWKWATSPNVREKASFLKENILPIEQSGQLRFIPTQKSGDILTTELGFDVLFVDGHTEKQMIPILNYQDKTFIFVADLVPTVGHIPLAYVAGYDIRPLEAFQEKEQLLTMAMNKEAYIIFQHDAKNEVGTLKNTERGIRLDQAFKLSEIV